MTNRQLQLMLHMVRILNRELHDPDKLDAALKEVEKTLENEPAQARKRTPQKKTMTLQQHFKTEL